MVPVNVDAFRSKVPTAIQLQHNILTKKKILSTLTSWAAVITFWALCFTTQGSTIFFHNSEGHKRRRTVRSFSIKLPFFYWQNKKVPKNSMFWWIPLQRKFVFFKSFFKILISYFFRFKKNSTVLMLILNKLPPCLYCFACCSLEKIKCHSPPPM
jgi:hypothetical protein